MLNSFVCTYVCTVCQITYLTEVHTYTLFRGASSLLIISAAEITSAVLLFTWFVSVFQRLRRTGRVERHLNDQDGIRVYMIIE